MKTQLTTIGYTLLGTVLLMTVCFSQTTAQCTDQFQMFGPATPTLQTVFGFDIHPITGDAYVVGQDHVQFNDGTSWTNVGDITTISGIKSTLTIHPGTLEPWVTVRVFATGFEVYRFDGASWVQVGGAIGCGCSGWQAIHTRLEFQPGTNTPFLATRDGSNGVRVLSFDGISWNSVGGTYMAPPNSQWPSLDFHPVSGNPVVQALWWNGSNNVYRVYEFDGSVWQTLGTPPNTPSNAGVNDASIAVHPVTGEVYLGWADGYGGNILVYRFDGVNWIQAGGPVAPGGSPRIDFDPVSGDLYAFYYINTYPYVDAARYDGSTWQNIPGIPEVDSGWQNLRVNATGAYFGSMIEGSPSSTTEVYKVECVVSGCTDPLACNYNPSATVDDSSCLNIGDPCDDGNPATLGDTYQPDCSCVGIVAQPSQMDYPSGNYNLCDLIKADWVGANDYRFVFDPVSPGPNILHVQGGPNTFLPLNNVTGLQVGQTYDVTVDALFGTFWVVGTVQTTITIVATSVYVNPADNCTNHGPHFMGDYIQAKPYTCGVDKWEWTFVTGTSLPIVYTKFSSNRYLRLSWVPGLIPGTIYNVSVRAGYPGGAYTALSGVECISIIGPPSFGEGPIITESTSVVKGLVEDGFALYPNPVHGQFINLNLTGLKTESATLTVLTPNGMTVIQMPLAISEGTVNQVIDLEGLASGIYLARVRGGDQVWMKRVVIQN